MPALNKIQLNDLPDHLIGEITKHLDPELIISSLPKSFHQPGNARLAYIRLKRNEKNYQKKIQELQQQRTEMENQRNYYKGFSTAYQERWHTEWVEKRDIQAESRRVSAAMKTVRERELARERARTQALEESRVAKERVKELELVMDDLLKMTEILKLRAESAELRWQGMGTQ